MPRALRDGGARSRTESPHDQAAGISTRLAGPGACLFGPIDDAHAAAAKPSEDSIVRFV